MPERNASPKISQPAVRRFPLYYRTLLEAQGRGVPSISSHELAERTGVTGVQVRKDLSLIGTLGKRGLGYQTSALLKELGRILGLDRRWPVVLVGVGSLGTALLNNVRFRRKGFPIVAAFEIDPAKVGVPVGGIPVYHFDLLPHVVRQQEARIGIIACSADAAQSVCSRMVESGLKAILNYAPVNLEVPPDVTVRYEDILVELETLSFTLSQGIELSEDVDRPVG